MSAVVVHLVVVVVVVVVLLYHGLAMGNGYFPFLFTAVSW